MWSTAAGQRGDQMKAPAFKYVRPQTLQDCLSELEQHGDEAQVLAGGQSLVPMLNLRLARPSVLIDIGGLSELRGMRRETDDMIVGALQTHADIAASDEIAEQLPLLTQVAPYIAHVAIRSRGTIGGSIALADPAAEWPACILALSANIELASTNGSRTVSAEDFFLGLYSTERQANELITAIRFPATARALMHGFDEISRRRGDFAIAGLALTYRSEATTLSSVRVALMGLGDRPVLARQAMGILEGAELSAEVIEAAGETLFEELDVMDDPAYPADYRRSVARSLFERVLTRSALGECQ